MKEACSHLQPLKSQVLGIQYIMLQTCPLCKNVVQEANHSHSGTWSKFGRCSGGGGAGGLDFLAQVPNPIIAPATVGPGPLSPCGEYRSELL